MKIVVSDFPSIAIPTPETESEVEALKKKPGVQYNDEKHTFYRIATADDINAIFYDRDTPGIKAFNGNTVKEPIKGKQYPAIILSEKTQSDNRGYTRTFARLSVNFGRQEGWKDVTALLQDGGHLGKQSYIRKEKKASKVQA